MERQELSWLIDLESDGPRCLALLNPSIDEPWVTDEVEAVDGPGLNTARFDFVGVGLRPLIWVVFSTT
jgi:hypothetical protein